MGQITSIYRDKKTVGIKYGIIFRRFSGSVIFFSTGGSRGWINTCVGEKNRFPVRETQINITRVSLPRGCYLSVVIYTVIMISLPPFFLQFYLVSFLSSTKYLQCYHFSRQIRFQIFYIFSTFSCCYLFSHLISAVSL